MPPPPAHWRKQERMGQYSPLFGEFFIVCKRSVIGCDADRLDYASDEPDFINVHAGAAVAMFFISSESWIFTPGRFARAVCNIALAISAASIG